jgi:predicted  nucleic acid-binding Zn-ribbon protein
MAETPLSPEVWDAVRTLAFQDGERVAVAATLQAAKARAAADAELEAAKAVFAAAGRELASASAERRAQEARLEDLVAKLKRTEERLASGQLHHEREILAAQAELIRLQTDQQEAEAAWMDTTSREEQLAAKLPEARAALALVESEAVERMAEAKVALRAVEERMSGIDRARRQAAQLVPPDIQKRYLALYTRTGGRPFALAVAGECSNCHASVPAAAVQQLRAHTGVPSCQRCGRLLLAG